MTVPSSPQNQASILTLVRDGPGPSDLDWSICMARAQGGDRVAYRRLLAELGIDIDAAALAVSDEAHA